MNQGVVLFHTTTTALRAEKIAKNAGLKVKLIPTPRELSSDCGIALLFTLGDRETVEKLLADTGVEGDIHIIMAQSP